MENRIKQIHAVGQRIWLDFIDRRIMDSGELQKLIKEDGISGVTSNPAIFAKAISSTEYSEGCFGTDQNGRHRPGQDQPAARVRRNRKVHPALRSDTGSDRKTKAQKLNTFSLVIIQILTYMNLRRIWITGLLILVLL